MLARGHSLFCSLLVCLGLHINISKSALHLIQCFCCLDLFCVIADMSIFLPTDKLLKILAVGNFSKVDYTCSSTSGHLFFRQGQFLCQQMCTNLFLVSCDLEWHIMYISLSHSFILFFSLFQLLINFGKCISCLVPLLPLPDVVITTDDMRNHWPVISGFYAIIIVQWKAVRFYMWYSQSPTRTASSCANAVWNGI